MTRTTKKKPFPDRKISETFLDFSLPLLEALGSRPSKDRIERVLMITSTVWNSVVLDAVRDNDHYVAKLRESAAVDPEFSAILEFMIARKWAMFANDNRLIGEYSVRYNRYEWRLRVEARGPATPGE